MWLAVCHLLLKALAVLQESTVPQAQSLQLNVLQALINRKHFRVPALLALMGSTVLKEFLPTLQLHALSVSVALPVLSIPRNTLVWLDTINPTLSSAPVFLAMLDHTAN